MIKARRPSKDLDRLWAVAHRWAHMLTATFGKPGDIASVGLSRRLALQCCNWLWSIEGVVRRLIIAAALAFDFNRLALKHPPRLPREGGPPSIWPRPPRFRVFAFAAAPAPHKGNTSRRYKVCGHVPYPADTLLRIGAAYAGQHSRVGAPAAQPRHHNPLRRRGRISRRDPDYRGVPDNSSQPIRRHSPGAWPRSRAKPGTTLHALPDLTEWRRVEEEWQRTLPAPHLARRIAALLRVVGSPGAWVRRLARRLGRSNLAARLIAHPPPEVRRPKLDRTPPPPLQPELAHAHVLVALDTS